MTVAPLGPAPSTRAEAERALADRLGSPVEARWVVAHVLGAGPSGTPVDAATWAELTALVDRRLAGEPLQYVLGTWAFRTLELTVDRRALIPRPETEQVVEAALRELRRLDLAGVPAAGRGSESRSSLTSGPARGRSACRSPSRRAPGSGPPTPTPTPSPWPR